MTNNDFDFIKSKFDNAQPDMPDSLNRNVIKKKILSKDMKKIIDFKQKKNNGFKHFLTAAACFVLIFGIAFAINMNMSDSDIITGFKNYDQRSSVAAKLEEVPVSDGNGCGAASTFFFKEEVGAESPDMIKTQNGYIFYAYQNSSSLKNKNKNTVYIFSADKNKTKLVKIIENVAADDAEIKGIFVKENRLIVNSATDKTTLISIYNIENVEKPVLISNYEQSGSFGEARIIENNLYVISNYTFTRKDKNCIPSISTGTQKTSVLPKNIVSFKDVKMSQYAVISTIDITSGGQSADLMAVLGGSAKIHFNNNFMYINEYIKGEEYGEPERQVDSAMKLDLKINKFKYADSNEIMEYSYNTVKTNDSVSKTIYAVGNYCVSIEEDMINAKNGLVLYDKKMNELDSITLDNIYVMSKLSFNEKKSVYVLPAYFTESSVRCYGAVAFEIQDDRIVITNKFKNDDDNVMYQGYCVMLGDYVYSFDINDAGVLNIFAHKYN